MEEMITGNPIESKAIEILTPGDGGRFPVIMTAFDGEGSDVLDKAGFRGRYVMFIIADGRVQDCFYDPRKATLSVLGESAQNMMAQIKRGWETQGRQGVNWADIEHGESYEPFDFEQMM